jgi:cell division protein FtsX
MSRRVFIPQFSWRAIILVAISFALIGLAVLFRTGSAPAPTVEGPYSSAALAHFPQLFGALGVVILLVLAAGLGACCGYIHLLRGFRKELREAEQLPHEKT